MKISLKKSRDAEKITEQQQDDIVKDFIRKVPHWGYSPASYQIFSPFANLGTDLDAKLQTFFECPGSIDEGNANVLDNYIVDMACEAVEDLKSQRMLHRRVIKDLYLAMLANRRGFQEELDFCESELAEIEAELAEIKSRIKK